MKEKLETVRELFSFFGTKKKWWIIPMLVVFLVFGFLILVIGSSPLAPIIYPLF